MQNLENFLFKSGSFEPEDFIFRPIVRSKQKCFLVKKNAKLSYSRARECVLKRLQPLPSAAGLKLGLHSFRAGGATAAAGMGA